MKIPLRFQMTEYDCGAVSLLNCFSYLFSREEIPALLVKQVYKFALDRYDEDGNLGNGGTSERAINKLAEWIDNFAKNNDFGIFCKPIVGEEVSLKKIENCLKNDGVVLVKCWQDVEHYVIVTKITKKKIYIFDPYYLRKDHYNNDRAVRMVFNKPFTHNRIVSLKRFFAESREDFSLGPTKARECVLFNKK